MQKQYYSDVRHIAVVIYDDFGFASRVGTRFRRILYLDIVITFFIMQVHQYAKTIHYFFYYIPICLLLLLNIYHKS